MKLIDADPLIVFLYEQHVKADRFEGCMIEQFIDVLRHCPEVKLEHQKGMWIWDKRTGTYHCSECGHDPLHEDVGEIEEYKYCMNCGAEMEVDG